MHHPVPTLTASATGLVAGNSGRLGGDCYDFAAFTGSENRDGLLHHLAASGAVASLWTARILMCLPLHKNPAAGGSVLVALNHERGAAHRESESCFARHHGHLGKNPALCSRHDPWGAPCTS